MLMARWKILDTMFQIALDYDKGVDIHLHETTPAGVAAINYMVETVEKTPQLKGKLTISHAFALATLNEQQVDELAHRMAAQQISIASTAPIGTLHMPLKQLHDKGVKVMTGMKQRYRPLVALRPGRHAGKSQSVRAALYSS